MKLKQFVIGGLSVLGLNAIATTAFIMHTTRGATAQSGSDVMARIVPYGVGASSCGPDARWDGDPSSSPGGSGDVCHRKINLINDRLAGVSEFALPTTQVNSINLCGSFAGKKLTAQNAVSPGKGVSAIRGTMHQRVNASTNTAEDSAQDSGNRFIINVSGGDVQSCILEPTTDGWGNQNGCRTRTYNDGLSPTLPAASSCDGSSPASNCDKFYRLHILTGTMQ